MKNGFHYTDIIRYDPREIADPPYRLHVTSIPPILPSKVPLVQSSAIQGLRSCTAAGMSHCDLYGNAGQSMP
jgi:hypothetical protein